MTRMVWRRFVRPVSLLAPVATALALVTGLAVAQGVWAAGPAAAVTAPEVRTYHGDNGRSGRENAIAPTRVARVWSAALSGTVYAQPLVLNVSGRSVVIAATEHNYVYGLDAGTGRVLWRTRQLGVPVPRSELPCGNIDPLGITGTPVYEPASGAVWVVAENRSSSGAVSHLIFAVDPRSGRVMVQHHADPPRQDPRVLQQRGALLAANGTIYVAYGGLAGDCGAYYGYVVGIREGNGYLTRYQTPSAREAGIWAPPGPVGDAHGNLYVAVGNGAATSGRWDLSDSTLQLSPALSVIGAFAPSRWAADNASDLDLGSTSPTLLPTGVIYVDGKSDRAYTLRAGRLGGVGSQLSTATVCAAYGGTARVASTVFVPCRDGIRGVSIYADGRVRPAWRAAGITGSPVATRDGSSLLALDVTAGRLYALRTGNGTVIGSAPVGAVTRFATPALSGSRAFVPTTAGVVAVALR